MDTGAALSLAGLAVSLIGVGVTLAGMVDRRLGMLLVVLGVLLLLGGGVAEVFRRRDKRRLQASLGALRKTLQTPLQEPAAQDVPPPAPEFSPAHLEWLPLTAISPVAIRKRIEAAPLSSQESMTELFLGLRVKWNLTVGSMRTAPGGRARIAGEVDAEDVFVEVERSPELAALSRGAVVMVTGLVAAVRPNWITLSPAKLLSTPSAAPAPSTISV